MVDWRKTSISGLFIDGQVRNILILRHISGKNQSPCVKKQNRKLKSLTNKHAGQSKT